MTETLLQKFAWTYRGCELPPADRAAALTRLEIDGLSEALVDVTSREVWIETSETLPTETLEHFLADLVLPPLLAFDGHLVLHAGVVESQAGAIGLIGPSGAGKSTLTASLVQHGCGLLSDDSVRLRTEEAGLLAEPLYPSLRLFPDSLGEILPKVEISSPVAHYSQKRRVAPDAHVAESRIIAIFRLEEPEDHAEITLERLAPNEACMAILANSFALDPSDRAQMRQRFGLASEAARRVPVFALCYPREYDRLAEVVQRVLDTAERVSAGSSFEEKADR